MSLSRRLAPTLATLLPLLLQGACARTHPRCEDDCPDSDVDSGDSDSGDSGEDTALPPFDAPARILFIGNSFTLGGPIPDLVDLLANDAGWPDPEVVMSAFGGESLEGHRGRSETVAKVDEGNWDVLVLQEYSTRPTDNIGDPPQFKTDATWFHDRLAAGSPEARLVLYETWARHPDHSYYPGSFADPAEMQAQLRTHYYDAADSYIPTNATVAVEPAVEVAPAGDAWERHLAETTPLRLHASDDYHAGTNGQYLNGLVIYSTIYGRSAVGRTPWRLDPADALVLQHSADGTTGATIPGGPTGTEPPLGLEVGQRLVVDLGSTDNPTPAGTNNVTDAVNGVAGNLMASDGARTSVDLTVTDAFLGVNTNGLDSSVYPASAASDSFFCGSFTDHADGLTAPGAVRLSDLDPTGRYSLRLFASRTGTDGSLGRLTRFSAGGQFHDLEVADNAADSAVLTGLTPASDGTLTVEVAVSPAGTGRFCYLGVLELERLAGR